VKDGVALVVPRLTDQPGEDTPAVYGVGDAGVRVLAVQGEDVVAGDRTPMDVVVALAGPALDAGEEPLDAGAVAADEVAGLLPFLEERFPVGPPDDGTVLILLVDRHQIL